MLLYIDLNDIIVFYQCEQSAIERFGRDVSYDKTMCSSRKSSIGDECNIFSKACSYNNRGGLEHLRHTGCASWTYISDYHHIAFFYFSVLNSIDQFKLTIEHTRATCEFFSFLSCD